MILPKYCGGSMYYALWRYRMFDLIGIGMHPAYSKKNGWNVNFAHFKNNEIKKIKNDFRVWAFSDYFEYRQYEKYKTEVKKALPQLINHFQKNFSLSKQEAEVYSNSVMDYFAMPIFYSRVNPNDYSVDINFISPLADYMENDIVSFAKIKELVKNSSNTDIEQALRAAFLTKKEPKIIDFLLDNFEYSAEGDKSLLFFALDYPQYIKVLLDKGADINYKNSYGETPLFYAIKSNNYEFVKLLLENGADVNSTAELYDSANTNI